jgi:hypothetical protein
MRPCSPPDAMFLPSLLDQSPQLADELSEGSLLLQVVPSTF